MRNVFLAVLVMAVSIPYIGRADEKLTSAGKKNPANTIEFQGQSLRLAYVAESPDPNDGRAINEYVPVGESLENWTQLIGIYHYPHQHDSKSIAGQMVKALKASNPLARFQIHESEDGKRVLLDFITWDTEKGITEFNIFIYQKHPQGTGLIAQQYALRAYGQAEGLKFMEELRDTRTKSLEAVSNFTFPDLTRDSKLVQ